MKLVNYKTYGDCNSSANIELKEHKSLEDLLKDIFSEEFNFVKIIIHYNNKIVFEEKFSDSNFKTLYKNTHIKDTFFPKNVVKASYHGGWGSVRYNIFL